MELRQMQYFVAVADEGHFTRAAQQCAVSQSGLSSAIRALESELGTTLFERSTRSVRITGAGRALLPFARQLLIQASAGRDAVVEASHQLSGPLHVGAEQCLGVVDLSAALEGFDVRYPNVDIHFVQAGSHELSSRVRAGELDIAFVAAASDPSGTLRRVELGTRPLVVIAHPSHPLAGRDALSWHDLAGQQFVDFSPQWGVRRLVDAAFAERGLERRVRISVDDVHTLVEFVDHGLGLAIVPQHVARKRSAAALRAIDLSSPEVWAVSALLSPRRGTAAARLLELVQTRSLAAA